VPTVSVDDFLFDDDNAEKFARHGLAERQVRQVLKNSPRLIIPNRQGRRADYLIIGRDNGGQCITIPIEPTADPRIWQPVTAWPCKVSERVRLNRARQRG
jgi:uncharacterized DUF497 family protein